MFSKGVHIWVAFPALPRTVPLCLQVSLVLSALQAGNKGTQACITAATAVSGIIADLDTTIMFATAGTLNAENNETFADHRYGPPGRGGGQAGLLEFGDAAQEPEMWSSVLISTRRSHGESEPHTE